MYTQWFLSATISSMMFICHKVHKFSSCHPVHEYCFLSATNSSSSHHGSQCMHNCVYMSQGAHSNSHVIQCIHNGFYLPQGAQVVIIFISIYLSIFQHSSTINITVSIIIVKLKTSNMQIMEICSHNNCQSRSRV